MRGEENNENEMGEEEDVVCNAVLMMAMVFMQVTKEDNNMAETQDKREIKRAS